MKRGDIYLVTLDPTEGREQQGYRPVLVISPQAFNEATKLPVILPITAGGEFTSFPRSCVGMPRGGRASIPTQERGNEKKDTHVR